MIIEIQESAKKDLKSIDKTKALKILKQIKNLEDFPHISNIKQSSSFYPPFRYRIGDYRVLFDVVDDTLIVINIKHRSKAYKK
ncbi:MAG: type II toxin-antitoxin system RelE/ParE family toxin [Campylobacterota bacterium]|nr:type II toxin-antitoxin system RelE/ParE family toxin [Campylobacterota bacterium]